VPHLRKSAHRAHAREIKGVSNLGGQASGVALMSSVRRHSNPTVGTNQNSPVSPGRAMAYVLALNDLLRPDDARVGKGRRRDIAGVGFLTWLRNPATSMPWTSWKRPPQSSRGLAEARSARRPGPEPLLSGGSLRQRRPLACPLLVTDWLPRVKENLKNWHEQLRVSYPWGGPQPVRLWQLLYAIDRMQPPAHDTLALLRRAIEGAAQPLGYAMLAAALARLRIREIRPARRSSWAIRSRCQGCASRWA